KAYDEAQKAPGAPPTTALEAQLGLARCLQQESGKAGEAEQQFRKLVTEDAPNAVLAGAWNGIGDITLAAGYAKKDQEKILDALYAYLRGVVQYTPAPGEATNEYERALAGTAKCFEFISQLETRTERKRPFLERANERRGGAQGRVPTAPSHQEAG